MSLYVSDPKRNVCSLQDTTASQVSFRRSWVGLSLEELGCRNIPLCWVHEHRRHTFQCALVRRQEVRILGLKPVKEFKRGIVRYVL